MGYYFIFNGIHNTSTNDPVLTNVCTNFYYICFTLILKIDKRNGKFFLPIFEILSMKARICWKFKKNDGFNACLYTLYP